MKEKRFAGFHRSYLSFMVADAEQSDHACVVIDG